MQQLCTAAGWSLEMEEFDILRGAEYDLTDSFLWESIFQRVESGSFDVIILTPPCGTLSRARFNFSSSGPRPSRTSAHPRGFPWLRNNDAEQVRIANFFVDRSLDLAFTQVSMGGYFLFEHPEQLGMVKTGDVPGSVWDFPNMRELIESSQAATWAIHQCFFGSDTPKPTRLGSNLPGSLRFGQCWHILDESGKYLGPLGMCPHNHEAALIGRDEDGWRTSAAAAYPPLFCEYLARLVFSATSSIQSVAANVETSHVHPAEALSQVLLQTGQVPLPEDIVAVFHLLPHTRAHPGTGDANPGKAFFAGANWEQAGFVVRQNTFSFPASCELICRFIQSINQAHCFGAFVLLHDVQSACHRDLRNAHSPNLVFALSKFSGGGVWQESTEGNEWRFFHNTWMRGEILPLQPGPAYVHARTHYHATEPWQGTRCVLIAYLPESMESLHVQGTRHLLSLGFRLPSAPAAGDSSLASGKGTGQVDPHEAGVCVPRDQDAVQPSQQLQQVQQAQQVPPGFQVHRPQGAGQEAQQVHHGSQAQCEIEVISSGDEHQVGADPLQGQELEEPFNPSFSSAFGQPMICRFEMCKREIVDGFGLCSPGRWVPAARERLSDPVQRGHAKAVRSILEEFVLGQLGDVKKYSFMLATGKIASSPFSEGALLELRKKIAATLPDPAGALEVPERQPFFLSLLAQSLQVLGDPDWAILTQGEECYANGMPLGHDKPLPRTPQVFRKRVKSRKLDETPFETL